jgi:uncharacterized phiE125 gp8 family phage protein
MSLVTLSDVKTHLGITTAADDALLAQLQAAADDFVEQYCQRSFAGGSFTEDHPGGGRFAFLRNYPVTAVTSVQVDPDRTFGPETALDPTNYFVHADRGVVESLGGPFVPSRPGWPVGADDFPGAVRVAYTTATGQVPAAVGRAYAELVGHWYRQVKTQVSTGQLDYLQQTNGSVVTEYPWGLSGGFRVPAGVLQLLGPYRVPNL